MPENSIGPSPEQIAKKPSSHPVIRLSPDMLPSEVAAEVDKAKQRQQEAAAPKPEQNHAPHSDSTAHEPAKPIIVKNPTIRLNTGMLASNPPTTPKAK